MKYDKLKSGTTVIYSGVKVKVVSKIRATNKAVVKGIQTHLVNIDDLREIKSNPDLGSMIENSNERVRFESALMKAKEREDLNPKNHNKEYTVAEVEYILNKFDALIQSSGYITDWCEWVERASTVAKEIKRTVVAISTEASRIHFNIGKPSPTIKYVLQKVELERIKPARKTTQILRYMIHNG